MYKNFASLGVASVSTKLKSSNIILISLYFNVPTSNPLKTKILSGKKIYSSLKFEGVIRIDFLVKGDNVYVNEINSVPGSLSYYLFYDSVFDFSYLLKDIILDTLERFNKKQTLVKSFSSPILNLKGVKGQKRL